MELIITVKVSPLIIIMYFIYMVLWCFYIEGNEQDGEDKIPDLNEIPIEETTFTNLGMSIICDVK